VFDSGAGVADHSECVQDRDNAKAQTDGLAAHDQAKSDRVVVDRAGPAMAAGRPRTQVPLDPPDRT